MFDSPASSSSESTKLAKGIQFKTRSFRFLPDRTRTHIDSGRILGRSVQEENEQVHVRTNVGTTLVRDGVHLCCGRHGWWHIGRGDSRLLWPVSGLWKFAVFPV